MVFATGLKAAALVSGQPGPAQVYIGDRLIGLYGSHMTSDWRGPVTVKFEDVDEYGDAIETVRSFDILRRSVLLEAFEIETTGNLGDLVHRYNIPDYAKVSREAGFDRYRFDWYAIPLKSADDYEVMFESDDYEELVSTAPDEELRNELMISGAEIAAGSITASKINVSSLSAISANLGYRMPVLKKPGVTWYGPTS